MAVLCPRPSPPSPSHIVRSRGRRRLPLSPRSSPSAFGNTLTVLSASTLPTFHFLHPPFHLALVFAYFLIFPDFRPPVASPVFRCSIHLARPCSHLVLTPASTRILLWLRASSSIYRDLDNKKIIDLIYQLKLPVNYHALIPLFFPLSITPTYRSTCLILSTFTILPSSTSLTLLPPYLHPSRTLLSVLPHLPPTLLSLSHLYPTLRSPSFHPSLTLSPSSHPPLILSPSFHRSFTLSPSSHPSLTLFYPFLTLTLLPPSLTLSPAFHPSLTLILLPPLSFSPTFSHLLPTSLTLPPTFSHLLPLLSPSLSSPLASTPSHPPPTPSHPRSGRPRNRHPGVSSTSWRGEDGISRRRPGNCSKTLRSGLRRLLFDLQLTRRTSTHGRHANTYIKHQRVGTSRGPTALGCGDEGRGGRAKGSGRASGKDEESRENGSPR
ncbi:hypothetical protein C7M84_006508 [Penaeus vannamei]|uniref:Uncharacterized protein n=1 Tax=Penaeus vannamei TaxID=6689 RepID=A0A423TEY7_PENVA|nr:hypothetical protein C7M84_006508 [Penaeus vannamei]